MKKIVICLISFVLVVCSLVAPVGAAAVDNGDVAQPLWDNTETLDVTVYFENGVGTAYSAIGAQFDTTSITTDIYIYRVSGSNLIYVCENHETLYDFIGDTTCSFPAVKWVTYRIDYVFTVTRNGIDEVINRTIYGTYTSKYN